MQQDLCLFKINLNKNGIITVTDKARETAIRLMQEENQEGYFIRVGVEGGGCSGRGIHDIS